jgi:hypothetical protein
VIHPAALTDANRNEGAKMKKYLPIAAILLVIGVIAAWLWPAEEPAPVTPQAPVQAAPKPAVRQTPQEAEEEEKNSIRVTFVNHLGDAHLKFTVDGADICTANAGQDCYGDVAYGKHVVNALDGNKVVRTMEITLDKNTANPRVVACFPTSPDC